jgi:hypothetical protein
MDLKKKQADFLEHVENILTDSSSFEELFDKKSEEFWLSFIEEEDSFDTICEYIEEDEFSYFVNDYLKAFENIVKKLDENDFYDYLYDFLAEDIEDISKENVDSFFEWN